jgi:CHASE2 domain-containing sensor protein
MTKIFPSIVIGLVICFSCRDKKEAIITIVNIGNSNRVDIGRQLGIVKKYSPKVIALDFHLVPDSLDKDTILIRELESINNMVQIVGLHDFMEAENSWDSLEVSHPKFKIANHGFSNLTTEDSILIHELPMTQYFDSKAIYCFAYVVAENSFGVKERFRTCGDKELKLSLDGLGENYRLISTAELFAGKFTEQDIKDKIVIMGYVGENEDYFYVDKEKTKKINGVEIHAAIVEELIKL